MVHGCEGVLWNYSRLIYITLEEDYEKRRFTCFIKRHDD